MRDVPESMPSRKIVTAKEAVRRNARSLHVATTVIGRVQPGAKYPVDGNGTAAIATLVTLSALVALFTLFALVVLAALFALADDNMRRCVDGTMA